MFHFAYTHVIKKKIVEVGVKAKENIEGENIQSKKQHEIVDEIILKIFGNEKILLLVMITRC